MQKEFEKSATIRKAKEINLANVQFIETNIENHLNLPLGFNERVLSKKKKNQVYVLKRFDCS